MNSNWRKDPITKRQMDMIIEMNEMSQFPLPEFKGNTKGEAYDYIQNNLAKSYECMDLYEMSH